MTITHKGIFMAPPEQVRRRRICTRRLRNGKWVLDEWVQVKATIVTIYGSRTYASATRLWPPFKNQSTGRGQQFDTKREALTARNGYRKNHE